MWRLGGTSCSSTFRWTEPPLQCYDLPYAVPPPHLPPHTSPPDLFGDVDCSLNCFAFPTLFGPHALRRTEPLPATLPLWQGGTWFTVYLTRVRTCASIYHPSLATGIYLPTTCTHPSRAYGTCPATFGRPTPPPPTIHTFPSPPPLEPWPAHMPATTLCLVFAPSSGPKLWYSVDCAFVCWVEPAFNSRLFRTCLPKPPPLRYPQPHATMAHPKPLRSYHICVAAHPASCSTPLPTVACDRWCPVELNVVERC